MRALGDKIGSKLLAERVGVPMAPWSGGPVADLDAARAHAETIGYPLMVKATAGGGGRGIRLVNRPEELDEAFTRASSEGAKTAGDATVFLERAVRGGRHVEVQVVADGAGDVWTLGVRDCSVQRRNQKVHRGVGLDRAGRRAGGAAAPLGRRAGAARRATSTPAPSSSSTSRRERLLSFLEVNTRLQVEHPVTEATTGVDIVKLQLHVAMGGRLADVAPAAPPPRGHAIEARLTAEDPEQGFAPAPGVIEHLALPSGPGVRVDTGVAAGDVIPPQFDSMIAKVIAWGRDRGEARARLARALRQTAAVIDGGTTNKAFLLDLLDRPQVRTGEVDTTWLDALMAAGLPAAAAARRRAAGRRRRGAGRARRPPAGAAVRLRRARPPRGRARDLAPDRRARRRAPPTGCGWPRPGATATGSSSTRPDGAAVDVTVERTGPVRAAADRRRDDLRGALRAAGPGLPRRGRRRRAPDLRRRGRAGARARRRRWSSRSRSRRATRSARATPSPSSRA